MHPDYADIRSRIKDPIQWFDSNAVPHYDKFKPEDINNIYAEECCLYEIGCQACGTRFLVAEYVSKMTYYMQRYTHWRAYEAEDRSSQEEWKAYIEDENKNPKWPLAFMITEGLHYGDPPRHFNSEYHSGCSGDTMNCEDYRVIEYWRKESKPGAWRDWVRHPEFEIRWDEEEGEEHYNGN